MYIKINNKMPLDFYYDEMLLSCLRRNGQNVVRFLKKLRPFHHNKDKRQEI